MDIDPFKNFTPKANPVTSQPAGKPQPPVDLAAIDVEDKDALRKLAKTELLYVIERNRGSLGVVTALRELMDRVDGKPAQASEITVKTTVRNESTLYGLTMQQQVAMVEYTLEQMKRKQQRLIEEQGVVIESQ